MNKKKKLVLLLFCMVLIVTGCGSNAKNSTSKQMPKSEEVAKEVSDESVQSNDREITPTEPAYHMKETEPIVMYATSNVNVRTKPDTDGEKKGMILKGKEVTVTGVCEENGWLQIAYEGESAFVCQEYFSKEKPKEPEKRTTATQKAENKDSNQDWVGNLQAAQNANQIMIVAASGSSAKVSLHNKNGDGNWSQILSTNASIGRNGIGKTSEGDGKTPTGVYGFSFAFGLCDNPGTSFSYTQVDDSYYWVDDSNSAYYNRLVSTNSVGCDWGSAEHIAGIGAPYRYVLAINYNAACTPGRGSAIFLHCKSGSSTAGCIAVPESDMIRILQNVQPGCVLIIDSAAGVKNY